MELKRFQQPELKYSVYVKSTPQFQKTHDTYDHWTLFIVEEGSFDYRMGNLSGSAVEGDMVLCPPGVTFYRKTNGLSFHLMGFQWESEPSMNTSEARGVIPIGKLRHNNNKRFQSTLSLFRASRHLPISLQFDYQKHLFKDLLYLLQIELSNEQTAPLYSEEPQLQRAVQLLQQKAPLGIPLKEIAQELGISQVQLTRLFKREFRITPVIYAANLRMEKVKQLLIHSTLTLSQIAEGCGFTDEHHLSKSFKKRNGLNPSSYRRTYRI